MNINKSIIDQQVNGIMSQIESQAKDDLRISDPEKLRSLSFLYLCVKTILDMGHDESFDCLTEGGGDFGVDAAHISEEQDGEFIVTLFQAKYLRDLEKDANFPEEGVKSLINAVRYLFDPASVISNINDRIKYKVSEIHSLIRDGYIPRVRVIGCNNGLIWSNASEELIRQANFGSQVEWEHANHDRLIGILQSIKPVDTSLTFSGKAIVEDFNYSRVMLGRVSVREIANLVSDHGERLLERNIRRFLGLQGNRVNADIQKTLTETDGSNFYFYNNGITLICDQFSYNALQNTDHQVKVKNLQIINGGQTCMTIHKVLNSGTNVPGAEAGYVLVRLYQLPSDNEDLVLKITQATNSQNPVDLKDLRSEDDIQKKIEMSVRELGFSYRRKKTDASFKSSDISIGGAAEAILAVWRKEPHRAKFYTREHFNKLYRTIFSSDLNGAQVVLAVLLYRIAENKRKRLPKGAPPYVAYGSCFIAMQMGKKLLQELQCDMKNISHNNFANAAALIESKGESYFNESVKDIGDALKKLYGERDVSLQQLSATFRRGDLISLLP